MKSIFGDDLLKGVQKTTTLKSSLKTNKLLSFGLDARQNAELLKRVERGINEASRQIAIDLKAALDSAMESSVWKTSKGNADIVDEGRLMESGRVTVSSSGLLIEYTEPYAALVHYGGYVSPYGRQGSRVYLPPRPWVEAVLRGNGPVARFPIEQYYERYISAAFNR